MLTTAEHCRALYAKEAYGSVIPSSTESWFQRRQRHTQISDAGQPKAKPPASGSRACYLFTDVYRP